MNSRSTPNDGQVGLPLGRPFRFQPEPHATPIGAVMVGVDPNAFIHRAVLRDVFGIPHVHVRQNGELGATPLPEVAVVIGNGLYQDTALSSFIDWLGAATAVVDIRAFAILAARDGYELELGIDLGTAEALSVFLHNTEAAVFPDAPRIEMLQTMPGFGVGDEFHFYHKTGDGRPQLRTLAEVDSLTDLLEKYDAVVWGIARTGDPAALTFVTEHGGRITVFDLDAVDHFPEESGAEGPAIQVFLNGLGRGSSVFGKFLCTYPTYDEYVDVIRKLAADNQGFAELEKAGRSTNGRDMYVLKIALNPDKPVVVMSTAIHSLEWGPTYGMLRWVLYLLDECSRNSVYAQEMLADHELWWVICANPDGWETRDQEALGVNLNRNFPSPFWNMPLSGHGWDAFNRKFKRNHADPEAREKEWGGGPGSMAETRTLLGLLEQEREFVTVFDLHETTAACSFYHQHEDVDGTIPHMDYHIELAEDLAAVSDGRFWSNANVMAYGPALSDFSMFRVQEHRSLPVLVPSVGISSWEAYAASKGLKAPLLEASGCDCTHFQSLRRSDYAALSVEQVLSAEKGRLLRNPFGEEREMHVKIHRDVNELTCRIYDMNDELVSERVESSPGAVAETIPPGGWMRLVYG